MVITTLISQLLVAVPVVIIGTQTLTSVIDGLFKINNPKWRHAISWIISVLVSLGFVATGNLEFGLPEVWQNYVFGGVAGLFAGASANGLYDWESVKTVFVAIENLFRRGETKKA